MDFVKSIPKTIAEAFTKQLLVFQQQNCFDSLHRVSGSPLETRSVDEGFSTVEAASTGKTSKFFLSKRPPRQEVIHFFRHLALMLEGGLSLLAILNALETQTSNAAMRECIRKIQGQIREGIALSTALKSEPDVFHSVVLGLVKIGEESGSLPLVLNQLADYYEKNDRLWAKASGALVYPAFVSALGLLLLGLLPVVTRSVLLPMFEQSHVVLNPFARLILYHSGWLIMVGLAAGFLFLLSLWSSARLRLMVSWRFWQLPVGRCLLQARVAWLLGLQLKAGLTALQAVSNLAAVLKGAVAPEGVRVAKEAMKEGSPLSVALSCLELSPIFLAFVMTGEESGKLDEILPRVGSFYQEQFDDTLDRMMAALEPAVMAILGLFVGAIVFSLVGPMNQLLNSL